MNKNHGLQGKSNLNYETVRAYVKKQKTGLSPDKSKRGPATTIPLSFLDLLECHVLMTQLEGNDETNLRHLKALIRVAIKDTEYERMPLDYVYTPFLKRHHKTVAPSQFRSWYVLLREPSQHSIRAIFGVRCVEIENYCMTKGDHIMIVFIHTQIPLYRVINWQRYNFTLSGTITGHH